MIKLFLLSFDNPDVSGINLEALSPKVKEKIEKTADKETKRDRIITYLFLEKKTEEMKRELCRACGKRFFSDDFRLEIDFTEKGKPFIKGIDCDISVSHTEGAALIAISLVKFIKIGADIEKIRDKSYAAAEKFIKRRLADSDISPLPFEDMKKHGITVERYSFSNGAFEQRENETVDFDCGREDNTMEKWCALEAILKSNGGGFSSLSALNRLKNETDCYVSQINLLSEKYALAFAITKDVIKNNI